MRTKRAIRSSLVVAMFFAALGTHVPATAKPGMTTRLSIRGGGIQPNGATPAASVPDTTSPDLSLDGLTVAFSSDASNLVTGDTNATSDVFVRKILSGTIVRASVTSSGAQANGASYSPSLSVDGRWLAFASTATNLVSGDTNGKADIFLKDLRTGSIRLVSVSSSGSRANGDSNSPFVSLFGQWVTFESSATNLAPDMNDLSDAFLRDVRNRKTSRVAAPGVPEDEHAFAPEQVWTEHARISYDGRFLVFTRGATRDTVDKPTHLDVFLLDRKTRKRKLIDVQAWAGSFPTMNEEPVISADGRYVAFTSWSVWNNDLTVTRAIQQPSPIQNDDAIARNDFDFKDIWVFDRLTGTVFPISTNPRGPIANGDNWAPSIAADGAQIAFLSNATNLVPGDENGATDVYVRDLTERTTARVSLGGISAEANGGSARPSISYEGKRVAFASSATNLAGADSNLVSDAFLRDRQTETPNRPPVLQEPFRQLEGLNQGEKVSLRLRARDPDGDPLRFGVIMNMPNGATLDTNTGAFEWTAGPDPMFYASRTDQRGIQENLQHSDAAGGRCVYIVFWVQDVRGQYSFALAKYFVRDAERTARCSRQRACFVECGKDKAADDD